MILRKIFAVVFLVFAALGFACAFIPMLFGLLLTRKNYPLQYVDRVLDIFLHMIKAEW